MSQTGIRLPGSFTEQLEGPTRGSTVTLRLNGSNYLESKRLDVEKDSRSDLEHLERFCYQVAKGLEAMTFEERQELLRLVVEGITVEDCRVRVETIIPTGQDDVKLRKLRGELVEPS